MALVNITNIVVNNDAVPFLSPIILNITFDVLVDLDDEIEWSLIYIGSPKDEQHDQVLDQFSMGPLKRGTMQFTLESEPADYTKIPSKEDMFGITALIMTVSYRGKEFFRVGYYVYINYTSEEYIENEPQEIVIEDISRQILSDKPRITKFDIDWYSTKQNEPQPTLDSKLFMFAEQQEKQSTDSTEQADPLAVQGVF